MISSTFATDSSLISENTYNISSDLIGNGEEEWKRKEEENNWKRKEEEKNWKRNEKKEEKNWKRNEKEEERKLGEEKRKRQWEDEQERKLGEKNRTERQTEKEEERKVGEENRKKRQREDEKERKRKEDERTQKEDIRDLRKQKKWGASETSTEQSEIRDIEPSETSEKDEYTSETPGKYKTSTVYSETSSINGKNTTTFYEKKISKDSKAVKEKIKLIKDGKHKTYESVKDFQKNTYKESGDKDLVNFNPFKDLRFVGRLSYIR